MKKYFPILFIVLYTFVLGEDTYPNFSNKDNKLKFEEQKITIKEVNETVKVVEGIIEPNYMILLNKITTSGQLDSNLYKKTPHRYIYSSEITQNNKILTELELIKIANVGQEYEDLINGYNNTLLEYDENEIAYQIESEEYDENKHILVKQKKNKGHSRLFYPLLIAGSIPMIFNNSLTAEVRVAFGVLSCIASVGTYLDYKNSSKYQTKWLTVINKVDIPEIKQYLNNEQLKSIIEIHNKKVYNEIKKIN